MSSDDALALAGEICAVCVYPRLGDLVRSAITHCTLDAEPLTDEQGEMLFRALAEASDGALAQIAHTIDYQTVLAFKRDLEARDDA